MGRQQSKTIEKSSSNNRTDVKYQTTEYVQEEVVLIPEKPRYSSQSKSHEEDYYLSAAKYYPTDNLREVNLDEEEEIVIVSQYQKGKKNRK